jgi:hypothetical protein
MISQKAATETSLTQEIGELSFRSGRDVRSEDFPSLLTVLEGIFQSLNKY